jgi:hypothetical protein
MGLYDRILQVEQVTTIGWFLYSSQQINREVLQSVLSQELDTAVELRWRQIRAVWYEEIPPQYEVSALPVLVEKSKEIEAQTLPERRGSLPHASSTSFYPILRISPRQERANQV